MNIDKNTFVDLLGLPEDDSKIIELRKTLNAPKPLLDEFFKEYGGTSVPVDTHKIELFFSDESKFDDTDNGNYGNKNLVFSGTMFRKGTDLPLPFGLTPEDSLDDVYKKLGRTEDYNDTDFPLKIWEFYTKDGGKALIYVNFDSGKYKHVSIVNMYLFKPEHEEVLKDIKVTK